MTGQHLSHHCVQKLGHCSSLTLFFFLALASATLLMGRALISLHLSLNSSTISLVTGIGFLRCFRSSSSNHSGTSQGWSELANLPEQRNQFDTQEHKMPYMDVLMPRFTADARYDFSARQTIWYIQTEAEMCHTMQTVHLWKEPSTRSLALFLDVAIWQPRARPSASRILDRLPGEQRYEYDIT